MAKDLSQTRKEWKVVFWHKAPYSTRSCRTNEMIKAAFTPILDKYHVDLAFNAHDHAYSRTYPLKNDQIVSSPASGTVYVTTGRSGAKSYKTTGDTPPTAVPPKYAKPRLAVNGILLNKPLMPTSPSQISGKWYFPIKPVVEFLGGSESISGNNETLSMIVENYLDPGVIWSDREVHTVVLTNDSINATMDNTPISLPDSVVVDGDENFLISADDMNKLFGFTWKHDSDRNILLLINPSRPGE
jgi:acid phosphatase type 7